MNITYRLSARRSMWNDIRNYDNNRLPEQEPIMLEPGTLVTHLESILWSDGKMSLVLSPTGKVGWIMNLLSTVYTLS